MNILNFMYPEEKQHLFSAIEAYMSRTHFGPRNDWKDYLDDLLSELRKSISNSDLIELDDNQNYFSAIFDLIQNYVGDPMLRIDDGRKLYLNGLTYVNIEKMYL